jgi:peroxiredoxin
MAADVGTKAPEFTLPDQDRQPVSLKAELSTHAAVVLAFFPAAFSGVCTKELCTFRDQLGALSQLKAQVYGISVDTFFALKAFATEQKLTFPLLSDFNKDTIQAYDVFNPDMVGLKGIAKRSIFLIDQSGTIRYKEVLEDARNEPDYAALNGAIAAL